jgi:hypothetical protein
MFDYNYDEDAIIRELDIEGSEPQFKEHVLRRVRQLLEERVGMRVEAELSDQELLQLDEIGDSKAKATAFLEQRFPNHQDMYMQELVVIVEQLKEGLANVS